MRVTIAPVRELVIVIADLYLTAGADGAGAQAPGEWGDIAGIESLSRFGVRHTLAHGWRAWLAQVMGCAALGEACAACVAGAALPAWRAPPAPGACWIATPVHLSAGLTRVHLSHEGLLRLEATELQRLAETFADTFGADGTTLTALPCGELLLGTPGVAPVPTAEPARLAGGMVTQVLPGGAPAAPLRRLMAETEMWLHGQALNAARSARGALPVTALWPWGAQGSTALPGPRAHGTPPQAFGRDAWLAGAAQLLGGSCQVEVVFEQLLAAMSDEGAKLVLRVADEMQEGAAGTGVAEALARLDALFIVPALAALRKGELGAVTLLLNDVCVRMGRASRWRVWRRRRPGLKGFA